MNDVFQNLLHFDAQATERLRLRPKENYTWWLAAFLAHSGDSWFWMAGLGLVWLFGNPEWHARSAFFAICIVVQALTVFAIKFTIKRARPKGEWGSIYRNTDPHSFPSGHATRAFLLVALAAGAGPQWFFFVVAIWAPLVSLARVMMGVHYISDILAGIALGLAFGWGMLVLRPFIEGLFPFIF
jgi:membrane-associated phospholipid phosphatase